MHKIKLIPDKPFFNNCEVAVVDVTADKEKQRCKITVEFAEDDVTQLKKKGLNQKETMAYYKEWLYKTVKLYIADDWECEEGYNQVMQIIEEHIERYF